MGATMKRLLVFAFIALAGTMVGMASAAMPPKGEPCWSPSAALPGASHIEAWPGGKKRSDPKPRATNRKIAGPTNACTRGLVDTDPAMEHAKIETWTNRIGCRSGSSRRIVDVTNVWLTFSALTTKNQDPIP